MRRGNNLTPLYVGKETKESSKLCFREDCVLSPSSLSSRVLIGKCLDTKYFKSILKVRLLFRSDVQVKKGSNFYFFCVYNLRNTRKLFSTLLVSLLTSLFILLKRTTHNSVIFLQLQKVLLSLMERENFLCASFKEG